jgi:hypothetical protein
VGPYGESREYVVSVFLNKKVEITQKFIIKQHRPRIEVEGEGQVRGGAEVVVCHSPWVKWGPTLEIK